MNIPPIIAVVGVFRSGTSCTAGILHKLGVSMGNRFESPRAGNPRGFYEAKGLARICRQSFKEPLMIEQNTFDDRIKALREWGMARVRNDVPIGAKHPTLCLMVPEMVEAWPGMKIIAVDRPIEQVIQSMLRRGWWKSLSFDQKADVLRKMLAKRDADIAALKVPTMFVDYASLIGEPTTSIERMIYFADLLPTVKQIQAAKDHVDPSLQHFGKA